MKHERFEKIVEGDLNELFFAWVFGVLTLILPFVLLVDSERSFLGIVFNAFMDGLAFLFFIVFSLEYVKSRKVYWRKMK